MPHYRANSIVAFLFVVAVQLLTGRISSACTVCHSKNPKMAAMHEALEFKDCFLCHGPSAKSWPKDKGSRKENDERCVRCHAKSETVLPAPVQR